MNNLITLLFTAILSFLITTLLWVATINDYYSKVTINKTTNSFYIEYQDTIYKLVPIKE